MRPVLRGNVTVTGRDGAAVLLDGLYAVGDLVVNADGMTAVTVSQCTVTGSVRVVDTGDAGANGPTVRVLRSLVGRLDLAGDRARRRGHGLRGEPRGAAPRQPGSTSPTWRRARVGDGATFEARRAARSRARTPCSTGRSSSPTARSAACATASSGRGSRTPRQFQPAVGRPSYGSVEPGDPDFLVLASDALETASESGNEVGVDAHLRRPEPAGGGPAAGRRPPARRRGPARARLAAPR